MIQGAFPRVLVGPASANPVADGEIDEHQSDEVGPDDDGVAEEGIEQPGGGQLHPQAGHPCQEYSQQQVAISFP